MRAIFSAIGFIALLASCASHSSRAPVPEISRVAHIEIVDRPNSEREVYRYVLWRGEYFGPMAFISVARSQADSLLLIKSNEAGISCVASIADALSIPASAVDADSKMGEKIAPSIVPVLDACRAK